MFLNYTCRGCNISSACDHDSGSTKKDTNNQMRKRKNIEIHGKPLIFIQGFPYYFFQEDREKRPRTLANTLVFVQLMNLGQKTLLQGTQPRLIRYISPKDHKNSLIIYRKKNSKFDRYSSITLAVEVLPLFERMGMKRFPW